jgi:hypothetical protein
MPKKKVVKNWIEFRFTDEEKWTEISEEDAIEKLERQGYYPRGTVVKKLKSGEEVTIPYAIYRKKQGQRF